MDLIWFTSLPAKNFSLDMQMRCYITISSTAENAPNADKMYISFKLPLKNMIKIKSRGFSKRMKNNNNDKKNNINVKLKRF